MKPLSVVLPFYYKMDEFKVAFPYNKRFLREDMEMVFAVDEPESGMYLREYLEEQSPICSYKIIENPNKHDWRNHAKATNVGICNSSGEYVIVMSPESICVSDVYSILVDACKKTKENTGIDSLHIGRIAFCKHNNITDDLEHTFSIHFRDVVYRGSACLKRDVFVKVRGFDENFEKWGGEDDDLRARLKLLGHGNPIKVWNAKAIHYENEVTRVMNTGLIFKTPITPYVNENGWGVNF